MKIISKYKDYYDYLAGIYGEDPIIVYVRDGVPLINDVNFFRTYLNPYKYPKEVTNRIGYFKDSFGRFNHDIPPMKNKTHKYLFLHLDGPVPLHRDYHGSLRTFYLVIGYYEYRFELDRYTNTDGMITDDILFEKKRITKEQRQESKAPIYIVAHYTRDCVVPKSAIIENPILKDTFIRSYIPSENIWDAVCEYIGLSKEIESRPLTDKEKIIQHGFDKITSFRKM